MFEPFASPVTFAPALRSRARHVRRPSGDRDRLLRQPGRRRAPRPPRARDSDRDEGIRRRRRDDRPTSVVLIAQPALCRTRAGLDFHPTGDAGEYEARLADSKGRKHCGNGSVVDWWRARLGTHVRAMRALFDGNQYESVVVVGHPLVRYFAFISRQSPHFVHPRSETEPRRALPPPRSRTWA